MPFPRPFNALVNYYVDAPPYCPESTLALANIQIRQLKDYIPYYTAELSGFHERYMVRWCFEPLLDIFEDMDLPSQDDPFPGFFAIKGSPFINNAYQLVSLEPIMDYQDPETILYYYALLRQVGPDEVPCPTPETPVEIEGGEDYETALEVDLDTLYELTFSIADTPQWIVYTALPESPLFFWEEIPDPSTPLTGPTELYTDDPPVTPLITIDPPANYIVSENLPSILYVSIEEDGSTPTKVQVKLTSPTSVNVTGNSNYLFAPSLEPNVSYRWTSYGAVDYKWFKFPSLSGTEDFRGVCIISGGGTNSSDAALFYDPTSAIPDFLFSDGALWTGTFSDSPVYLRLSSDNADEVYLFALVID